VTGLDGTMPSRRGMLLSKGATAILGVIRAGCGARARTNSRRPPTAFQSAPRCACGIAARSSNSYEQKNWVQHWTATAKYAKPLEDPL